jgi:hypothetical protein
MASYNYVGNPNPNLVSYLNTFKGVELKAMLQSVAAYAGEIIKLYGRFDDSLISLEACPSSSRLRPGNVPILSAKRASREP